MDKDRNVYSLHMKTKSSLYIMSFGLMAFLIYCCHQDDTPRPLKFTAYAGNPVLSPGAPGEDDLFVALPYVVKHESIFYLFYLGVKRNNIATAMLATSTDGYHFTKFEGNPVLAPDGKGYDAFGVGAQVVIWQDSLWVMYFNAIETATWGPCKYIGRATATALTGPWTKDDKPVLTGGKMGEWDDEYVFPGSIIQSDDGVYRMYYTGGADFAGSQHQYMGMAMSIDGINWKKYNDPATTQRPFADSDPVLKTGKPGDWDDLQIWTNHVFRSSAGYEMYYGGFTTTQKVHVGALGYAFSQDGISWEKYSGNPVYTIDYDREADNLVEVTFEGPSLIFLDTLCLMYYDYGIIGEIRNQIGVATARLK